MEPYRQEQPVWATPDDTTDIEGNTNLPVELQSHLHLAGIAHGGINLPEGIVVQVGVRNREDVAVEHVEHLPAEIQPKIFSEVEALCEADVLV